MPAVTTDDIVQGAVKYLQAKADVLAVLGTFTIGDAVKPGLFQYQLWALIEGSQSTCCVVSHEGGWAGPNVHNTLRFPRLLISIWGDPIRGANSTDPGEVQRRVNRAFEVIDSHLHRVASGSQMWGSIRTVTCTRLTEPFIEAVPDGDGLVRLQAYYAISQG